MELSVSDKNLLRLLQDDARLSNVELANLTHMSAATCYRKTKSLIDRGVVTGFHAHLDPKELGLNTLAMVGLVLDRSTPESFANLEKAIQSIPVVEDCLLVSGEFDYLLKVRVADMESFNRFHAEMLITLPGVSQARTFFVMKSVKEGGLLPI